MQLNAAILCPLLISRFGRPLLDPVHYYSIYETRGEVVADAVLVDLVSFIACADFRREHNLKLQLIHFTRSDLSPLVAAFSCHASSASP